MGKSRFLKGLSNYERDQDSYGVYNAVAFLDENMKLPCIKNDEIKPLFTFGENHHRRIRIGSYIDGPTVNLIEAPQFEISKKIVDVSGQITTEKGKEVLIVQAISKYYSDWVIGFPSEKFAMAHKIFLLSQIAGGKKSIDYLLESSNSDSVHSIINPEYNLNTASQTKKFIEDNRVLILDDSFSGAVCTDIRNQGETVHAILSKTELPTFLFQLPGMEFYDGIEMDERYCLALEQMTGVKLDYHIISADKGKIRCITRK